MDKKFTKKIRHISHNDLDGYGATILTELIVNYYPKGMFALDLMNITPNKILSSIKQTLNEIDNYDLIIVTDLAISQPVVDCIINSGHADKFRVMDHHVSTVDDSNYNWLTLNRYRVAKNTLTPEEYSSGLYKNGATIPMTCGTELYYNFIQNDKIFDMQILDLDNKIAITHLVDVITNYDTFVFDSDESEISIASSDAPRLNTLFHTLGHDEFKQFVDDYIHSRDMEWMQLTTSSVKYPWISKVIELETKSNDKYIEAALKRLQVIPVHKCFYSNGNIHEFNATVGLVFAEKNGPMIGKAARDTGVNCDFCAVVSTFQVSMYRVKDGFDVAEIAKILGGGGHVKASGFTVTYDVANKLNEEHFIAMMNAAGNVG